MLGHARLLLAFGVLLAHGKLLPEATSRSMVSAFFVVSGYLMMLTLSSNYGRAVLPFYWNRILRIYPLHIVLCCLIWILFPSFVSERRTEYATMFGDLGLPMTVMLSFMLLPRYAGFFNKPAWTLPFELIYYVLAPLIFRFGRTGILTYLAVGVLAFCWLRPASDLIEPFGLYWTASGTPEGVLGSALYFGIGALAFDLQAKAQWSLPQGARSTLTWAGMLLLAAVLLFTLRFWNVTAIQALQSANGTAVNVASVAAILLVLFAWTGRESEWSKWAGDLCYPVYMIHFMFTDYLVDVSHYRAALVRAAEMAHWPDLEFVLRSLVAAVGSIVLGTVWVAVERRTIRKWRWGGAKPAQASRKPGEVDEDAVTPALPQIRP